MTWSSRKHLLFILLLQLMSSSVVVGEDQEALVSFVLEPFTNVNISASVDPTLEFLYEETVLDTNISISDADIWHGVSSLHIDYINEGTVDSKFTIQSFLEGASVYMCHGSKELSFSYKQSEVESTDHSVQWKVSVFDSADCEESCSDPDNLEAWEYYGDSLESDEEWKTIFNPIYF